MRQKQNIKQHRKSKNQTTKHKATYKTKSGKFHLQKIK